MELRGVIYRSNTQVKSEASMRTRAIRGGEIGCLTLAPQLVVAILAHASCSIYMLAALASRHRVVGLGHSSHAGFPAESTRGEEARKVGQRQTRAEQCTYAQQTPKNRMVSVKFSGNCRKPFISCYLREVSKLRTHVPNESCV